MRRHMRCHSGVFDDRPKTFSNAVRANEAVSAPKEMRVAGKRVSIEAWQTVEAVGIDHVTARITQEALLQVQLSQ
jgi:hypothetical protein